MHADLLQYKPDTALDTEFKGMYKTVERTLKS